MGFIDNIWDMTTDYFRSTIPIVNDILRSCLQSCSSPHAHDLLRAVQVHVMKFSSIVAFMAVCNVGFMLPALFLFGHPTMGLCAVMAAFTSMMHTLAMLLIFRKHSAVSRILESYSSQFLLGAVAGTTLIMSNLTTIVSLYFGRLDSTCSSSVTAHISSNTDYECYTSHLVAAKMISFFGTTLSLGYSVLAFMFFARGEDMGLLEWSTHQYESLDSNTAATETATSGIGTLSGQSYQSTPSAV